MRAEIKIQVPDPYSIIKKSIHLYRINNTYIKVISLKIIFFKLNSCRHVLGLGEQFCVGPGTEFVCSSYQLLWYCKFDKNKQFSKIFLS